MNKNSIFLKIFLLLNFLIILTRSSNSQTVIDFQLDKKIIQEINYGWDEYVSDIYVRFQKIPVKIKIEPLPEIDVTSKATVKILVPETFDSTLFNRLSYTDVGIDVTPLTINYDNTYTTDEIKKLKYKHKIIEGEFNITPMETGAYIVSLILDFDLHKTKGFSNRYKIYFTLDESGKCIYLRERPTLLHPLTLFPGHPLLNKNNIVLKYKDKDFFCELNISPPLSINNSSNVDVYLKANENIRRDVVFSIFYYPDVLVSEFMHSWEGPIFDGDEYRGNFKIMPTKTGVSGFKLKAFGSYFNVEYMFDESGKLVYLGRTSLMNWYLNYYRDKYESLNYPYKVKMEILKSRAKNEKDQSSLDRVPAKEILDRTKLKIKHKD